MNKNSDRHYIFAKIADKSHVLRRIGEPRCKAVLDREVGVQVDAISLIADAPDTTIRDGTLSGSVCLEI